MKHKRPPPIKEDVTCNLVPMIDIMFLLLLFFMLSADMTQRQFEDVVLPSASMVQTGDELLGDEQITTINLFHKPEGGGFTCSLYKNLACRDAEHWRYAVRSLELTRETLDGQIKVEAESAMETEIDPLVKKRMSARKVVIRADGGAPFGDVQRVMMLCGQHGIYKIEVAAAEPPKA
jgi:biopolymer transport protein ExbD